MKFVVALKASSIFECSSLMRSLKLRLEAETKGWMVLFTKAGVSEGMVPAQGIAASAASVILLHGISSTFRAVLNFLSRR